MKRPAILSQCQLRRLHYCNRNQQSVRFISLMSPPVHLWGQQFSIEHRGTLDESHRRRIVLKAWVTSEQFFLIWQQTQLSRQYEFPSSWCLSKRGQRLHPPLNAKYRNIHDIADVYPRIYSTSNQPRDLHAFDQQCQCLAPSCCQCVSSL